MFDQAENRLHTQKALLLMLLVNDRSASNGHSIYRHLPQPPDPFRPRRMSDVREALACALRLGRLADPRALP